MPRLRAIGFAPAATVLTPSLKIDWASTVAVVVPSPATSEVFEATSRTICAPMFWYGSSRPLSLAAPTPALGEGGRPPLLSGTTLGAPGAGAALPAPSGCPAAPGALA